MWDPQHLTNLKASRACYGDNFTFLYLDYVRVIQESHLWSSRLVTVIDLLFYVDEVCTSQKTYIWS
jgi:hypothetical protein